MSPLQSLASYKRLSSHSMQRMRRTNSLMSRWTISSVSCTSSSSEEENNILSIAKEFVLLCDPYHHLGTQPHPRRRGDRQTPPLMGASTPSRWQGRTRSKWWTAAPLRKVTCSKCSNVVEVVTPSMECPWPPPGVGEGNVTPYVIDHVTCMPQELLSKFASPPSMVHLVL